MTRGREIGADVECLKMLKEAMVRYGHDQRGGTRWPIAMIRLEALQVDLNLT